MRHWLRDPLLYMAFVAMVLIGCVANIEPGSSLSDWRSFGDLRYQTFRFQGHDYLRFSFSSHDTPVVHNPDCTKCQKENLQGPAEKPLENVH